MAVNRFRQKVEDRIKNSASVDTKEREEVHCGPRSDLDKFYDTIYRYADAVSGAELPAINQVFIGELARQVRSRIVELDKKGLALVVRHYGIHGEDPEVAIDASRSIGDRLVVEYHYMDRCQLKRCGMDQVVSENPGTPTHLRITLLKTEGICPIAGIANLAH